MLCASFVVQSILGRLFCVNAFVLCLKLLCAQAFCAQCFCCARYFSLTVRAFWRAEQQRWDETNFEEMRKVCQCSDEMKQLRRTYLDDMWEDGMRWEELRWGVKSSNDLRWDEVSSVKCRCEVWSAGCEACTVKCEESVCLALHCTGAARRSCSWTTTAQQVHTKHARTGLAYARRMQVLG